MQRPARDQVPAIDPIPSGPGALAETLTHSWSLLEDFLRSRGGCGRGHESATVKTERTTLSKHLFWLATGRLPGYGRQRHLDLEAHHAERGWTPLVPEDATDLTIVDYLDELSGAGIAENTRDRDLGQLTKFYRWLSDGDDNPAAGARLLLPTARSSKPTSSRQDGFYTPRETRALLCATKRRLTAARAAKTAHKRARTDWLAAEVDYLIVWLLWGTGVDAADICALTTTAIDLENATITWNTTAPAAADPTNDGEDPAHREADAATDTDAADTEAAEPARVQPIPAWSRR